MYDECSFILGRLTDELFALDLLTETLATSGTMSPDAADTYKDCVRRCKHLNELLWAVCEKESYQTSGQLLS